MLFPPKPQVFGEHITELPCPSKARAKSGCNIVIDRITGGYCSEAVRNESGRYPPLWTGLNGISLLKFGLSIGKSPSSLARAAFCGTQFGGIRERISRRCLWRPPEADRSFRAVTEDSYKFWSTNLEMNRSKLRIRPRSFPPSCLPIF